MLALLLFLNILLLLGIFANPNFFYRTSITRICIGIPSFMSHCISVIFRRSYMCHYIFQANNYWCISYIIIHCIWSNFSWCTCLMLISTVFCLKDFNIFTLHGIVVSIQFLGKGSALHSIVRVRSNMGYSCDLRKW